MMPPRSSIGLVKVAFVSTLNKTKLVLFNHENSTVPTNIDIKMGNTSLEVCDKYEYLGVILDSHFTLEKNIGKTVSTACNRCYMLCKMC